MIASVGEARIRRATEVADWRFPAQELIPLFDPAAFGRVAELFPEATDARSGELILSIHSYVIDLGHTRILVDPGNGDHKDRPVLLAHHGFDTGFLARLAAEGIEPDSVDIVVSTHLHPDHCGGNTRLDNGEWVPAFPNARYVFTRADLEWISALPDTADPCTVAGDLARTYDDSIRPVLPLADVVEAPLVLASHGGTEVRLIPAPGHSAGHSIVEVVDTSGAGAIVTGDVIHHPFQLLDSSLAQSGDADPAQAARTRRAVLERAAEHGWAVLTAHFPMGSPDHVIAATDGGLAWA